MRKASAILDATSNGRASLGSDAIRSRDAAVALRHTGKGVRAEPKQVREVTSLYTRPPCD
jgi:hypothetical protein